jgi:excisionase family DNA binding protein
VPSDELAEPAFPLLLRVTEVAQILGVGRTKVFALLKTGELPVVRIGRSVRIPYRELREWIWQRVEGKDMASTPVGQRPSGPW